MQKSSTARSTPNQALATPLLEDFRPGIYRPVTATTADLTTYPDLYLRNEAHRHFGPSLAI